MRATHIEADSSADHDRDQMQQHDIAAQDQGWSYGDAVVGANAEHGYQSPASVEMQPLQRKFLQDADSLYKAVDDGFDCDPLADLDSFYSDDDFEPLDGIQDEDHVASIECSRVNVGITANSLVAL